MVLAMRRREQVPKCPAAWHLPNKPLLAADSSFTEVESPYQMCACVGKSIMPVQLCREEHGCAKVVRVLLRLCAPINEVTKCNIPSSI